MLLDSNVMGEIMQYKHASGEMPCFQGVPGCACHCSSKAVLHEPTHRFGTGLKRAVLQALARSGVEIRGKEVKVHRSLHQTC